MLWEIKHFVSPHLVLAEPALIKPKHALNWVNWPFLFWACWTRSRERVPAPARTYCHSAAVVQILSLKSVKLCPAPHFSSCTWWNILHRFSSAAAAAAQTRESQSQSSLIVDRRRIPHWCVLTSTPPPRPASALWPGSRRDMVRM